MDYLRFENEKGVQKAERMLFIDFRLRFIGTISRRDISEQFGIMDAAATREISDYRELAEANVKYSHKLRANAILDTYKPVFDISAEKALSMLGNGFNKNLLFEDPLAPYQRVGIFPTRLDVDLVAKITRAMSAKVGVKCRYLTSNSDNTGYRTLFPTAIFYDGKTWMFRAFHKESEGFKNFHFIRLDATEILEDEPAPHHATIEADGDWNTKLPLTLKLHPNLTDRKEIVVRNDFGLDDKDEFTYFERAALIYYLIENWSIDVSEKPSTKKQGSYNFQLMMPEIFKHYKGTERIFDIFG